MNFKISKLINVNYYILFLAIIYSCSSEVNINSINKNQLDKIALQILFYFTFGGIGIWAIIRLFTLSGAIKDYNRRIAGQVGLDTQEMATLNLL